MKRLVRWTLAPYRAVWNTFLDFTLGAEEPFEYQGTTTPDEFDRDHSYRERLPR